MRFSDASRLAFAATVLTGRQRYRVTKRVGKMNNPSSFYGGGQDGLISRRRRIILCFDGTGMRNILMSAMFVLSSRLVINYAVEGHSLAVTDENSLWNQCLSSNLVT